LAFNTAGSRTATVSDITDPAKTANTSSSITVNAGPFVKLQLLAPGETAAPGTAAGKTGAPSAQTACTPFNVTVNAVDANWNVVSTVTDTMGLTSSDPSATLPANAALASGTKSLGVTPATLGNTTFSVADVIDGTKSPNT